MAYYCLVSKMAKSKEKKKEGNTNEEKPKKTELKHVLGALYGIPGEEYEDAAGKLKEGKISIESYKDKIRAGIKAAGKIVYDGEVRDASDETLAKAVVEIMTKTGSETTKDMLAVLAIGETYGYHVMKLGSYGEGVEIKRDKLSGKILEKAKGIINKFQTGLELPDDMTPEEKDALEAAKQYGIKASWAQVSNYILPTSSYKELASLFKHAALAPGMVSGAGANVMENYVKGLTEGRAVAAKKKAGIAVAEK